MIDPDSIDEHDQFPEEVVFPGTVMMAGILWMVFGIGTFGLGLLNWVLLAAMANPGGAPGGCCGLVFGLAFTSAGWNTIRGTASDTRGNASGSIVLGLLYAGLSVFAVAYGAGAFGPGPGGQQGAAPGEEEIVMLITAGFCAVVSIILLTAGVLAFMGRSQYREWRQFNKPRNRLSGRRYETRNDD